FIVTELSPATARDELECKKAPDRSRQSHANQELARPIGVQSPRRSTTDDPRAKDGEREDVDSGDRSRIWQDGNGFNARGVDDSRLRSLSPHVRSELERRTEAPVASAGARRHAELGPFVGGLFVMH